MRNALEWIFVIGAFLTGIAVLPFLSDRMFLHAIVAGIASLGCWRLSVYFRSKELAAMYKDCVNADRYMSSDEKVKALDILEKKP
jgi:hypothetical protein